MTISLFTGSNLTDHTSAAVAAASVSSPVWLPWLQSTSEVAGLMMPTLGVAWLIVQIVAKLREMRKK